MAKNIQKKLNNLGPNLILSIKGVPWAGIVALTLMVYGLGYLGAYAMDYTDAWSGGIGAGLKLCILPLLMIFVPFWSSIIDGAYVPVIVLICMPLACAVLWYVQGRRNV